MCHTLGKEVILLTQNDDDVPFDVRHLRYIKYEYTPPGMKKFEQELESTITNVLKRIKPPSKDALFRNIDAELYNLARSLYKLK